MCEICEEIADRQMKRGFDKAFQKKLIKWLESDKGKFAMEDALNRGNALIAYLRAEREVNFEELQKPFTI